MDVALKESGNKEQVADRNADHFALGQMLVHTEAASVKLPQVMLQSVQVAVYRGASGT